MLDPITRDSQFAEQIKKELNSLDDITMNYLRMFDNTIKKRLELKQMQRGSKNWDNSNKKNNKDAIPRPRKTFQ